MQSNHLLGETLYKRRVIVMAAVCVSVLLSAGESSAACMNKFVGRSESTKQVVTLLTGKLTFQEAQALAQAINRREAPPLEWVDEAGKLIARQHGELKIVRPMPVGCDGRKSGVVLSATFTTVQRPQRKMNVKLNPQEIVAFDEQAQ